MKAGRILKVAAPNYVDAQPEHLRDDAINTLNVVLGAAAAFNAQLAEAEDDTSLSPDGRNAARARVAASAHAVLDAIEATTIKSLDDHAASIETGLLNAVTHQPPTDAAERIAHELHLQEVRNQLRQLPIAERTNLYRTTTDPLVLAAMDTAPMTLSPVRPDGSRQMEPFIDPADRRAAILERAEATDPAASTMLRQVQSLREVYALAVNGVRQEIRAEVPAQPTQPVAG